RIWKRMSQPSTLSYRMKSLIASTAKGGRNTGRFRYEMPRSQCWPELQAALTSAALRLQSIICEVSLGSFSEPSHMRVFAVLPSMIYVDCGCHSFFSAQTGASTQQGGFRDVRRST